jgi:surface antigen
MSEVSDETLMSYIDGELDWADRRLVESAIHRQPDLQDRLRVFAATGLNLQRLYSQPMQEAVPDHLLRFVLEAPVSTEAKGRKSVRERGASRGGFFEALKDIFMPGGFRPAVAYAFSAVFVIGVTSGVVSGRLTHSSQVGPFVTGSESSQGTSGSAVVSFSNGAITAQGEFARALETAQMNDATSWPVGGNQEATFKAKFSFIDIRQKFCRQYEMKQGTDSGSAGVACRNDQGQWMIEHNIFGVEKAGGAAVHTAGHGPIQAIDTIVDKMIIGNVLGQADEASKIKAKWERYPAPAKPQ